jgi:hypothetical protein
MVYNVYLGFFDWLIDWLMLNVQRAIFQLDSRREKKLNATGLETRKGDGHGRINYPVQKVSYGPLIMSIVLIMSCYTGFFNVRRGWQSLNTGPRFYLRLIRKTGWLLIYTSRTTDGCPFKPKKLSVTFLYPGVPAGWPLLED